MTHHNALDTDLYLRIAPELYLKRLLVGGFDRIFEIGKNFRNEGISLVHNPEFTMMELYWAYVDYNAIMELVENMIAALAADVIGTTEIVVGEHSVDLRPPWPRRTIDSLLKEYLGLSMWDVRDDPQAGKQALLDRHIEVEKRDTFATLVDKALKHVVWPKLMSPTFAIDYPLELSPLAKTHRDDPRLVERFQPIIGGKEMRERLLRAQRSRWISAAASRSRPATRRPATKRRTCSTKISCVPWSTACRPPAAWVSASIGWRCCFSGSTPYGTSFSSRNCGPSTRRLLESETSAAGTHRGRAAGRARRPR